VNEHEDFSGRLQFLSVVIVLIIAVLALILNLVISFLLYYVYSVAPECADISDSLARRQCLEQKLKAN